MKRVKVTSSAYSQNRDEDVLQQIYEYLQNAHHMINEYLSDEGYEAIKGDIVSDNIFDSIKLIEKHIEQ